MNTQLQDLRAQLDDKIIHHLHERVKLKNQLANRYSVQKSVFTKKVKTAEDNAVAYLEMMKEMMKAVDSANANA